MKINVALCVAACGCALQGAVEVRQVMHAPRYVRGDVNVRTAQPADRAAWVWMPGHDVFGVEAYGDAWSAKAETDVFPSFFFRFRNDFVSDGSPLRFDVSGDERFTLYLDGVPVARGPQRGMVEHWYYQSYEVKGLAPGPHRLEAVCWQLGAAAPLAQLSYRGGFLFKAEGTYDAQLTTGKGKWLVAPLSNTVMTDRGTSKTFGAGNQCRVTGTGFPRETPPEEAWRTAAVVRPPVNANRYGGILAESGETSRRCDTRAVLGRVSRCDSRHRGQGPVQRTCPGDGCRFGAS